MAAKGKTLLIERYAKHIAGIDAKIRRLEDGNDYCEARASHLIEHLGDYIDTVKVIRYCEYFETIFQQHLIKQEQDKRYSFLNLGTKKL